MLTFCDVYTCVFISLSFPSFNCLQCEKGEKLGWEQGYVFIATHLGVENVLHIHQTRGIFCGYSPSPSHLWVELQGNLEPGCNLALKWTKRRERERQIVKYVGTMDEQKWRVEEVTK